MHKKPTKLTQPLHPQFCKKRHQETNMKMMRMVMRRICFNISKSKCFSIVLISTIVSTLLYRCIDNIGSVVTAFLQECHEATGFAWQLFGGGLDKSGDLKVIMYAMFVNLFQYCLMLVIGVLLAKQWMVKSSRISIQIGKQA